jgi:ferrous iron transport protein A
VRIVTLAELAAGGRGRIDRLDGAAAVVQRLYEFGLCEGEEIEVVAVAPLGDPIEVRCGNVRISVRRADAAGVHLA